MFKFVGHTRKGSGRRSSAVGGHGARVKEKIAGSQIRQGNNAGSKNRFDAIMIPRPPLVQWRVERYAPSFRGEGWGKRSLQSAPYHRFGVPTRPEPHLPTARNSFKFPRSVSPKLRFQTDTLELLARQRAPKVIPVLCQRRWVLPLSLGRVRPSYPVSSWSPDGSWPKGH